MQSQVCKKQAPTALHHSLTEDDGWGGRPSSAGALLWRADPILGGTDERSSSTSGPGGARSPSWDPGSPTSSRRNLNFDKKKSHTKYQPHTISSRTISSAATNTSRIRPTLCHISGRGGRLTAAGGGTRGRRPPEAVRGGPAAGGPTPPTLLPAPGECARGEACAAGGPDPHPSQERPESPVPRRRPDALPWRSPRACGQETAGPRGAPRPPGEEPPPEGSLGPNERQVTYSSSRYSYFSAPTFLYY